MNKKYTLGIIGGGNMANAILNGIINSGIISDLSKIIISDIDTVKLSTYSDLGIVTSSDNMDVINNCQYIIFAVKPQIFSLIKDDIINMNSDQYAISIMAGISIDTILEYIGKNVPVCRVMPNTPCMIKQGMSVLCYRGYDDKSVEFVNQIFESIGEIALMDESLFDGVTSVSGSGPAYVYTFIDAMVKGGVEGGLSEKDSRKLAIATVIGAANMIKCNSDKPIQELIDAVCSKGGTTIEAINTFKDNHLTDIIVKGVRACRNRSKELSGK